MKVLVTGGAGYIGSHAVVALMEAGHGVVVLDSLVNGYVAAVDRASSLASGNVVFVQGDVRDRGLLDDVFAEHCIEAVMHFAGVKAVGESVKAPLKYYECNVVGTLVLCRAMEAAGIFCLIFSSSATVYGDGHPMPLHEELPAGVPTNPYGRSKLVVEQVLADLPASDERWRIGVLRYFNPIGAHESGQIGEAPRGRPDNLLPYLSQVASGQRKSLAVYGDSYPTHDGTGVRDYIHVMDLVEGHIAALNSLELSHGIRYWNLGTGQGHSVLDVIRAFENVTGERVTWHMAAPRVGDMASYWADPDRAQRELGWVARRDLNTMIRDHWRWQRANPTGYPSSNTSGE